jgi:hypothetical protein
MVKTFSCEKCVYKCIKESEYKKHLLTKKHLAVVAIGPKPQKMYPCLQCGQIYKHASSKWNHKRTCKKSSPTEQIPSKEEPTNQAVLLKQMELQKQEMQQMKQQMNQLMENKKEDKEERLYPQEVRQKFKMQNFLDEDCKDAMNLSEFIDSFAFTADFLRDNFSSGSVNTTKTYSKLVIEKLKTIEVNKRPIHCSDVSRNALYIKDNNIWVKYKKEENEPISNLIWALFNKLLRTLGQLDDSDFDEYNNIISTFSAGNINTKMIIPEIARHVSNIGNNKCIVNIPETTTFNARILTQYTGNDTRELKYFGSI